jgi:hypothetical protein
VALRALQVLICSRVNVWAAVCYIPAGNLGSPASSYGSADHESNTSVAPIAMVGLYLVAVAPNNDDTVTRPYNTFGDPEVARRTNPRYDQISERRTI